MSDDFSDLQLIEDFSRESLQLNQQLEKMIEHMENMSVKLSYMAYDMVVLRTSPDLTESLKKLEDEFLKCKAAICGFSGGEDIKCHPAGEEQNIPQE